MFLVIPHQDSAANCDADQVRKGLGVRRPSCSPTMPVDVARGIAHLIGYLLDCHSVGKMHDDL